MNERKRKKVTRRLLRKRLRKNVIYQLALQAEDAWNTSLGPAGTIYRDKPADITIALKGRIPWYDQAIKFTWSWIEKILPGKGFAGTDITRIVQAPVPDEVKEYLEDEEIDFGLREKGE